MPEESVVESIGDIIKAWAEDGELVTALARISDANDLRVLAQPLSWQEAVRQLHLAFERKSQWLASHLIQIEAQLDMLNPEFSDEDHTRAAWGVLGLLDSVAMDQVLSERDEPRSSLAGLEP
jgi:hypothetical protein